MNQIYTLLEKAPKILFKGFLGICLLLSVSLPAIAKSAGDLSVNACPVITSAPANKTVCIGTSATFTVAITGGTGITYQWRRNGTNITGATSSSYTIASTLSSDNGAIFSVRISSTGCTAITSSNATLTVNSNPTISTQPTSQTNCAGTTASFSVSATGTGISYQWTKNGANITGATSATYTTPATSITDNSSTYFVKITNASGCTTTSNTVSLTVNTTPVISSQPASVNVCSGTSVTFNVTSTGGTGVTYQWRRNGNNITGATSSSYTISSPQTTDNGAVYSVRISSTSCAIVTSSNATLTVRAYPTISTQPASQADCVGSTTSFTVSATGTGLSYQWTKNGANISGATSATYTTAALTSTDNGSVYQVKINSSTGCNTSSNTATLTVNTGPVITTQPVNKTVCAGSTNTFTVVATGTNLTYQWTRNGTNIAGATSASYTTPVLTTAYNNSRYRVSISSNGCTSALSSNAVLKVNANATISKQPANATVCLGSKATFGVTATGTSLTYQWRKNGVNIAGATSKTYTTPVTISTDNGALYSVTVTTAGCSSVISSNATLTIGTAPVITTQPVSQTLCVGAKATFSVAATGSGITYQWKKNGANISGATSTTYTTPTTTAADNLASYTVVVISACGNITSTGAKLYVNNTPAITVQPANVSACLGSVATFTVTATGNNLKYQWRKNGTNITGATAASYTTPSTISTDNGALYSVIITSCSSVTSANAKLTILSLPSITTQPVSKTVIIGASVTFSVAATGTGLSYQWQKNGTNIGGATSTSYTISSVIVGSAGNYTVKVTNSSSCSITSNIATLSVTVTNQWTGGTSTDWFTTSNWSGGVIPTSGLDVILPASLTRYPVVTGNAIVKNIIVSTGATLTLSTNATLSVYGDFVNSGTFNASTNSTVTFTGTVAQTISGTHDVTFNSLNINNTQSTVSITTAVNLVNTLTLGTNSKFATTGYSFTLISNATGTARIAAVPTTATFTGNINMQRYIPANNGRYWYHVASAVSNGTVAMWQAGAPSNGIYVTGPFTGASSGGGINTTGISAYTWDAANANWSSFPKASNTETILKGVGYRVFVRDGSSSVISTTAKTFSITGTPNIGNQTYTLQNNFTVGTTATGWNMLGNPYPSNIDGNLNTSGWINKSNLDGFATYIWDADAKTYLSCNGGIGACTIPSSQSFWVKVKPGGGTLTATENVKVSNTSLAIYRTAGPTYIPVKLINGNNNGTDITYLRFEDDANTVFDDQYDAYKLSLDAGNIMYLSSLSDTIEYSIQARPLPDHTRDTIDLKVSGPEGNHILDFSDRTYLSDEFQLYLIDSYNGNVIDLNLSPVYSFDIIPNILETTEDRFKIVFEYQAKVDVTTGINTPSVTVGDAGVYPNPVRNNEFYINQGEAMEPVFVTVTDLSGRMVFTNTYSPESVIYVQLGNKLPEGTYIVESRSGDQVKRSKIVVD